MTIRLCLSLMLCSGFAYGQTAVQFAVLSKTSPFSGYAVGYAKAGSYLFVRDWENYYHYSFEANIWSKLKFRKKPIKLRNWAPRILNAYSRRENKIEFPVLTNQIPLSFLPSFSKILLITDQLEILDTETMELSYMKIEGGAPISTGIAVWEEKVHLFGGIIIAPKASSGKAYKWDIESSAQLIAFDAAKLTFQELESMPGPRICQGALVNEKLFTFGTIAQGKATSDVWCYDPRSHSWEVIGEVPIDIASSAIASSGQHIFLVGTRGTAGYLGVYDTGTHVYTEYPTNVKGKLGVACVRDNKLYYFGGIDVDYPGWIDRNMYVLDLANLPK